MKSVLLIGLGRFGMDLAQALSEQGNEVLAVDRDEARVNDALKYVTSAQIGDATSERFIESLGVRNFELCIVSIGDDFRSSLEATALLKEKGAPFVLSRATGDSHAKFLLHNGADEVIRMERHMARWTAVTYSDDRIFDYMQLSNDYAIYEASVPAAWQGKTVVDLDVRRRYNINVLAVKRAGVLTPLTGPGHVFSSGETLLILGARKDMNRFLKL